MRVWDATFPDRPPTEQLLVIFAIVAIPIVGSTHLYLCWLFMVIPYAFIRVGDLYTFFAMIFSAQVPWSTVD